MALITINAPRELEDNINGIETALRILDRVSRSTVVNVQDLYTASSQLSQVNAYVNQLIGASNSARLVKVSK